MAEKVKDSGDSGSDDHNEVKSESGSEGDDMPELVEAIIRIIPSMLQERTGHVAVRLDNYIVMFGGTQDYFLSHKRVWRYNLDSGRWRSFLAQGGSKIPAGRIGACGAALNGDVYMIFGRTKNGRANSMWRLSGCTSEAEALMWKEIKIVNDYEKPSPRDDLDVWAHDDELWVFGGYGPPLDGYLNTFGDWKLNDKEPNCGWNNQLLKFDPGNKHWTNLEPKGAIPSPRHAHAIAKLGSKVWMFGGSSADGNLDDLYELDLPTLTWSKVDIAGIEKPVARSKHSLTPTSFHRLLLYGGCSNNRDVSLGDCWVFETVTKKWHQEHIARNNERFWHTATAGYDGDVVITGGFAIDGFNCPAWDEELIIVTQPKSLLRLGIEAVYTSGELLKGAWKTLPEHLATIFRDKLY